MAELNGRVAPEQISKNSLELPWVNSGNDGALKMGETGEIPMLPSFCSTDIDSLGGTSGCCIVGETVGISMDEDSCAVAVGTIFPVVGASKLSQCVVF